MCDVQEQGANAQLSTSNGDRHRDITLDFVGDHRFIEEGLERVRIAGRRRDRDVSYDAVDGDVDEAFDAFEDDQEWVGTELDDDLCSSGGRVARRMWMPGDGNDEGDEKYDGEYST